MLNLPSLVPPGYLKKAEEGDYKLSDILELNKSKPTSLSDLIELDVRYLNFGTFYPAKVFKCTFRITNTSNSGRTVSLNFDDTSHSFTDQFLRTEFSSHFNPKLLAALLESQSEIPNTEVTHKCWYLMLPPSKSFEKSLTISLNPGQKMEVGVVIKSPQIAFTKKFCSILRVSLAETDPLKQSIAPASASIFSLAEVDTPKLECARELIYTENGIKVVPLVVRFDESGIQRLKIPFKNNGSQEVDIVCSVIQYPGNESTSTSASATGEKVSINMVCSPNNCKIPAKSVGLVNLNVIKNDKKTVIGGKDRQQRLLIAKLKNTQMLYYFVLDTVFIFE